MRRLCALALVLGVVVGCVSPDEIKNWKGEALKDWNGDRMKMTGESETPYSPRASTGMR